MSPFSWSSVRPNSTWVEVYNEALVVYLFDESMLPHIRASGADIVTGYAKNDADIDAGLQKLADEGVLIAYELDQDDPVGVEVVVGPPLEKKELKSGRWLKPQRAFLRLPSGELRIDTANTLSVDEDEKPEDPPGRVTVPPGDYHVRLYRLDWDGLEELMEEMDEEDEEWPGPQEILVLTPADSTSERPKNRPLLRFPL